jgi:hypothetical protein
MTVAPTQGRAQTSASRSGQCGSTGQEPVRADDGGSLGDWEIDASLRELSLELGEGGDVTKPAGRVVGVGHEDVYERDSVLQAKGCVPDAARVSGGELFVHLLDQALVFIRAFGLRPVANQAFHLMTFRMSPAKMDGPWCDANIIPRFNAAGLTKFAFHMPDGMPMIGEPPTPEAPGRFPTGYFGRRQDALDWLAS